MATTNSRAEQARGLHFFSFLVGAWIVLAPFVLHYGHTATTANSIVIGLLVMGLSFIRLRSPSDAWASWTLAGMGLWLVLSPFIFGYNHTATYWNELLFGIALIVAMFSAVGSSVRHHSHLAH